MKGREERKLTKVTKGGGLATGGGVAIRDTSELKKLLGGGGGDDASTTWGGDETHGDATADTGGLHGDSVWVTEHVTPIADADGEKRHLGVHESTANGSGDFLGALDAEAEMAVVVTEGNKGLEAGALTGSGLLLDRLDLEHLVLEAVAKDKVDDLRLLDGETVLVDLLHGLDAALLDEAAQLGLGLPLLLVAATTATATATTASTSTFATATAALATSTATLATATTTSLTGRLRIRHLLAKKKKKKKKKEEEREGKIG